MDALALVKSVLPFIGTALGGPLGGAAAAFIGSKLGIPEATVQAVTATLSGMTPEALSTLKETENEFQLKMAGLGYDSTEKLEELNVRAIEAVNKTMQAEVGAEHWPSYSWRPFIGFMFGTYVSSLWILPLFHVVPVILTPDMTICIGGILGIASWFRGKAQADPNNPATNKG